MKNVVSQLPWDLWIPNLTEWCVLMQAYYLSSHTTWWSRGHRRSHENEKCFKSIFTWSIAISLTNMPNHNTTYFFDHLVTWVHVTNELRHIFTYTRLKINKVMACNESPLHKVVRLFDYKWFVYKWKNITNRGAYK